MAAGRIHHGEARAIGALICRVSMKKNVSWSFGILVALAASAAGGAPPKQKPSGKKPVDASGPAELTLVSATRVGGSAIYPGNPIRVRLAVRNNSPKSARVAVALAPMYPGAATLRSAAAFVHSNATTQIEMTFPVDPGMVKAEQFQGTFLLVDPAKPPETNFLLQRWRDANQADNHKSLTLPVTVPLYDVTATLAEVFVYNDCNPGKAKSNWSASFSLLSSPTPHTPTTDWRVFETPPGSKWGAEAAWPGPTLGVPLLVTTGERYTSTVKVRMPRVPKDRHMLIQFFAKVDNGPAYDARGNVGSAVGTTPPNVWRNNGTVTLNALKLHDPRNALGNCGPQPFAIKVRYTAIPTSMFLQ